MPRTEIVKAPGRTASGKTPAIAGSGLVIVTVDCPVAGGVVELLAVIVTVLGVGGMAGALYQPSPLIFPSVSLPPGTPFTAQSNGCSGSPARVAVNFIPVAAGIVAVSGSIVTRVFTPYSTVTVTAFERRDGGPGSVTVIEARGTIDSGTVPDAVRDVGETKVVVRLRLPSAARLAAVNPTPSIVKVAGPVGTTAG